MAGGIGGFDLSALGGMEDGWRLAVNRDRQDGQDRAGQDRTGQDRTFIEGR